MFLIKFGKASILAHNFYQMFIVEGILVFPEIFSNQFICNLTKCKGACCWEGDFGAPVTAQEADIMDREVNSLIEILHKDSFDILNADGRYTYDKLYKDLVTPLLKDGSCAYLVRNEFGIAQCGWELAHNQGKTIFKKPISCHLYPIRIKQNRELNTTELHYDQWDICSAACALGKEHNVPVFRFVRDALVRRFGLEFYHQLEDIYSNFFASKS